MNARGDKYFHKDTLPARENHFSFNDTLSAHEDKHFYEKKNTFKIPAGVNVFNRLMVLLGSFLVATVSLPLSWCIIKIKAIPSAAPTGSFW